MPYCKSCGVELDGSAKRCPLCSGPVSGAAEGEYTPPYPENYAELKRGRVDYSFVFMTAMVVFFILRSVLKRLFPGIGGRFKLKARRKKSAVFFSVVSLALSALIFSAAVSDRMRIWFQKKLFV